MGKPLAVWLLLSTIWGTTWLFIKIGLEHLPPFSFAGIRFVIATVPLLVIIALRRIRLPRDRSDWILMIWTGWLNFSINYSLVFWGQQYVSSGLAALLYATFPLFGLAMAHMTLPEERMTTLRVLGVLLGVGGVGLIFSNQLAAEGTMALWGSAAIVIAAGCTAYADVVIKRRGGHLDPMVLTAGQMMAGFVPILAVGLALDGNPLHLNWTPEAVLALLYLAFAGSSLAFVLLYWLIRNMAVTHTMLITLATPLIAVLLGIIVLHEELTWRTTLGGAAIMSGLAMVIWNRTALLRRRLLSFSYRAGPRDPGTGGEAR